MFLSFSSQATHSWHAISMIVAENTVCAQFFKKVMIESLEKLV